MIFPPFVGPRLKIARGHKHLSDLKVALTAFRTDAIVNFEPDDDSTCDSMDGYRLQFSHDPRPELAPIIGDVVHNYRASLDMMIGDLVDIKKVNVKRARYPFGTDIDAVKETYNINLRNLGSDILDTILETRPYKNGGKLLRGLHDFDVVDKHEILAPMFMAARGRLYPMDMVTPLYEGAIIRIQKGYDPRDLVEFNEDGPEPFFPRKSKFFPGGQVIETLEDVGKLVDEIVSLFADKFGSGNSESYVRSSASLLRSVEIFPGAFADFINPPD
jgi:hypothetical protein